jgi:hypothetical protein
VLLDDPELPLLRTVEELLDVRVVLLLDVRVLGLDVRVVLLLDVRVLGLDVRVLLSDERTAFCPELRELVVVVLTP